MRVTKFGDLTAQGLLGDRVGLNYRSGSCTGFRRFVSATAAGHWLCASLVFAAAPLPAATTIYVTKHFEVRDHDAPVKYVFNGDTRVARVTGSLARNERVQKLRLRAGWNLVSLAVSAPNFLGQWRELTSGPTPMISALYRWQPTAKNYGTIASGETVAAGAVLWVSARMDVVASVRGRYEETTEWRAPAGGTFVAAPALEAQPLTLPAGVNVWRYQAQTGRWEIGLAGGLASVSDLPPVLSPGEAIYVHATEPTDLRVPAREDRIHYYQPDHLGSSSVMTDATGALFEETAFYPCGEARNQYRVRSGEEAYKFTQKERDQESGFHHLEARYLAGALSRFVSVDPKYAQLDAPPADPQQLNLYAYTRGNPLRFVDPTGLEDENAWWDPLGITGVTASESANYGVGALDASGAMPFWDLAREDLIEANPGVIQPDSTAYKAGHITGTIVSVGVSLGEMGVVIANLAKGGGGLIRAGATRTSGAGALEATEKGAMQLRPLAAAPVESVVSKGAGTAVSTGGGASAIRSADAARAAHRAAVAARNVEVAAYMDQVHAQRQVMMNILRAQGVNLRDLTAQQVGGIMKLAFEQADAVWKSAGRAGHGL